MPGAMRKMGVYLGLVEDADGYAESYDDGYRADGYERDGYERASYEQSGPERQYDRQIDRGYDSPRERDSYRSSEPARPVREARTADHSRGGEMARGGEVARVERGPAPARDWPATEVYDERRGEDYGDESYRITTLHPRTYNEAVTIGEHFRAGTPVIMNLTEMADTDAKRLVDFAAGLTFGLHGRVERVTAKVFLLSPQNVTVTAQDKARIAENGFFNQS